MPGPSRPSSRTGETGGVTIMVALTMLIFITITAVSMSRNSFREVVIAGTARQGAMARSVADAGIEWSIYWMDTKNSAAATGTAANLGALQYALLQAPTQAGRAWDIHSATPNTAYVPAANVAVTLPTVTTPSGTVLNQTYSTGVTAMGKLTPTDTSQGNGPGAFAPGTNVNLLGPDLWAVRIDAQVTTGAVTFVHAKEGWITTPLQ